jgi:hypothetical protein
LRDTAEIFRRRLPERLLKHGDESRHGFITEIGRNLLHARAGGQFSNCDDQVQLLTPAPECQPGFPDHETSETALAERDAPRASSSSTRSDSSTINSRSSGEIESVQHRSNRSTAPGSIYAKNIRALAVARLLCSMPPGTQTAQRGGTIHRPLGTPPPSADRDKG